MITKYMHQPYINKQVNINKIIVSSFLAISMISGCFAQGASVPEDSITQEFYHHTQQQNYWFSSRLNIKKAADWMTVIESAGSYGIQADASRAQKLRTSLTRRRRLDDSEKKDADRQITSLVLNFIKELQEGNIVLDFDEVKVARDSVYIRQLINSKPWMHASYLVARLDCKDPDYLVLKKYLNDSTGKMDDFKYKSVILAMNYRRYLTINNQPEYVLVNIPETQAKYYRNHLPVLGMKVVVGKKKSATPTIASYINSMTTFPHWNVPYNIAVTELLPKVQKNENYLEQQNFEIVDAKGNLVEDSDLKWEDYTERNFPYYFRQSTGSDNSLGVLKFNLNNPFSIFLHSTSVQSSFSRDFRFLSHGCIRLEKPFDMAIALMRGDIDIAELKSGKKNTESKTLLLPGKVPVYIIYSPAVIIDNKITFLPDVYSLIK